MKSKKKLWIFLFILIILTPVGIWLPALFGAGGAWGEWAPDELKNFIGYVPRGLEKLHDFWNAPFGNYEIKGWNAPLGYVISGFIGVAIAILMGYLLGRIFTRKRNPDEDRK